MKKTLVGLLTLISFSSFADSLNEMVCKSSRGYTAVLNQDGGWDTRGNHGCSDVLKCSTDNLTEIIKSIPEEGNIGSSLLVSGYIEIKNKVISNITMTSRTDRMKANYCSGDINESFSTDCHSATACVIVSLEYDKCRTRISYNSENGSKISTTTCPSGRVIINK